VDKGMPWQATPKHRWLGPPRVLLRSPSFGQAGRVPVAPENRKV